MEKKPVLNVHYHGAQEDVHVHGITGREIHVYLHDEPANEPAKENLEETVYYDAEDGLDGTANEASVIVLDETVFHDANEPIPEEPDQLPGPPPPPMVGADPNEADDGAPEQPPPMCGAAAAPKRAWKKWSDEETAVALGFGGGARNSGKVHHTS